MGSTSATEPEIYANGPSMWSPLTDKPGFDIMLKHPKQKLNLVLKLIEETKLGRGFECRASCFGTTIHYHSSQ
jgi:hypothetical protein